MKNINLVKENTIKNVNHLLIGGATDIRIGEDSLYSRVIVAGGGSGSSNNNSGYYGGGTSASGQSAGSGYAYIERNFYIFLFYN